MACRQMRPRPAARRAAVAIAVVVACLLPAPPTAAVPIDLYDIVLSRGRLAFGTLVIDTPPPAPISCPGSIQMAGTTEDNDPVPIHVDNMGGVLDIATPELTLSGISQAFVLLGTGTAGPGATPGDYSYTSNSFTGLTYPSFTFAVRRIDTTTCVPGQVLCSGTATLTLEGSLLSPADMPLVTGDQVVMTTTTGAITSMFPSCPFPLSLVFRPGASVSLSANPAFPGDTGAVMEQI